MAFFLVGASTRRSNILINLFLVLHRRQLHTILFDNLPKMCRIGEASVPGPFRVSTINPTQIHGHVDDVIALRNDVCTTAENSATIDAQRVAHQQFKKAGINLLWSAPVSTISQNAGTFRGRAAGVSIHTPLPIHPIAVDLPSDIRESARLLDGIIHLNNDVCCHIGVVYAPPHNDTFANPVAILNRLTFVAAERAVAFKGPAILSGDWNVNIEQAEVWKFLRDRGWVDAASIAAKWHRRQVQPTCRNVARKSFLLLNPMMAQALLDCYVFDEHVFAQHPVLLAEFDFEVCIHDRMVWHLPFSTDEFIFDEQVMNEVATKCVHAETTSFECAVENNDVEHALSSFVRTWEKTLMQSAVDATGKPKILPKSCLGRCSKPPWILRKPSCPVIKCARSGDYNPQVSQANASIRRHTKQLRRIQSLERQILALQRNMNEAAKAQCEKLWIVILQANGYRKNFQYWMLQELGFFIPGNCPSLDFIAEMRTCFRKFVDTEVLSYNADQTRRRKLSVAIDIAKGGSSAYQYSRTRRWRKFQKGKIYNAEEHVAIESFVTTLIHWTFFLMTRTKLAFVGFVAAGNSMWHQVLDDFCLVVTDQSATTCDSSFAPNSTQYNSVLQSSEKCYPSTILYYKVLLQKVLLQYYKVLIKYYKVLLRTTKY